MAHRSPIITYTHLTRAVPASASTGLRPKVHRARSAVRGITHSEFISTKTGPHQQWLGQWGEVQLRGPISATNRGDEWP